MRRKQILTLVPVLGFLCLTVLLFACGTEPEAPVASETVPETAPGATIAPATAQAGLTAAPTATPGTEGTSPPSEAADNTGADELAAAVASRTAVPTPTPGIAAEQLEELAAAAGLTGKTFLGLKTEDWIDVALSALVVLVGYLVGVTLLFALLKRIVGRSATKFDDAFLAAIEGELRWLVVLLVTRYALLRLGFWSDGLRTLIDDVTFALGVAVGVAIALKLIRFGAKWYQDNLEPNKDKERLNPVVTLFQRFGYMLVIIVAVSMGLSHFGINVTALSAALIFGALLVGLGAKNIISDAVSGFIILIDQPFRVGDSIELEDLGRVGDVVDIGTRTTHIRTRDNRLVIVPNSAIGGSQVINYSYPDPEYRVQIEIGVAYGSDFDQVRSVIHDTVRGIDGVLPDKPVDALYHVFGASSRTMRVRWWIDSVKHETRIVDRVSEALEVALDKAGIDLPFNTESLIVQVDPKTIRQLALSRQKPDPAIDQPAAASTPDGRETE